jgi:hypothetical protein
VNAVEYCLQYTDIYEVCEIYASNLSSVCEVME